MTEILHVRNMGLEDPKELKIDANITMYGGFNIVNKTGRSIKCENPESFDVKINSNSIKLIESSKEKNYDVLVLYTQGSGYGNGIFLNFNIEVLNGKTVFDKTIWSNSGNISNSIHVIKGENIIIKSWNRIGATFYVYKNGKYKTYSDNPLQESITI